MEKQLNGLLYGFDVTPLPRGYANSSTLRSEQCEYRGIITCETKVRDYTMVTTDSSSPFGTGQILQLRINRGANLFGCVNV